MIQRKNIEAVFRLSGVQSGLLFHYVHSPKAGFYFTQHVVSLHGDLNPDLLAESWRRTVERHQALRTSFHWQDADVPLQVIERRVELPFEQLDWSAAEGGERERLLGSYLEANAARGFEIARAPLMRLALIRFSAQEWRLCWSNHHLILDGWSAAIVAHDAFRIYEALLGGWEPSLPPAMQYQDYLRWLYQQDEAEAEGFWRRMLSGYDAHPLFDAAGATAPVREVYRKRLCRDLSERLRESSRRSKVTLSNVMQAAWAVLLGRYSGRRDVVFGAVTSGRNANLHDMEAAAGLFINTLPIRVWLTPELTVRDLLDAVQEYNLEIQAFEYLPLAKIQRASGAGGGRSLFDSMIVYENYPVAAELAQGNSRLRVENVQVIEETHFPLTILIGPGEEFELTLQYDRSRFGESIRTVADDFQATLEFFCSSYDRPLREFTAGEMLQPAFAVAERSRAADSIDYVEPRTPAEMLLAKLWRSVLQCERIGIYDNFFSLGGDSIRSILLKAMARRNGMDFELQDLFDFPTIASLSLRLRSLGADTTVPASGPFALVSPADRLLLPAGIEDAYPLTAMQSGMLYHASHDRESSTYLYTLSFEMEGRFSPDVFALAVRELLTRHPVLRTSFELAAYSIPLQLVHRTVELPLEIHDLRTLSLEKQDEIVAGWFTGTPALSCTTAPLLRFHVHVRSADRFHLGLWVHHAILDGWSLSAMMRELLSIYQSHFDPAVEIPDAPSNLFREFVRLERECVGSAEARAFWSSKLKAVPDAPTITHAVRSAATQTRLEAALDFDQDLSAKLAAVASTAGVTMKSILLTAHCRVLGLLSGSDRAVAGYVVDGRPEAAGADQSLGLFLNTVPLKLSLDGTWMDAIRAAHAAEAELLPYRRFPLVEIHRMNGGAPVFRAAFNFTNFHLYREAVVNGIFKAREQRARAELTFDLFADFSVSVSDQTIRLTLQADGGAFSLKRLQDLLDCYRVALEAIAADPFARIDEAGSLPSALRQDLLEMNTEAPIQYPRDRCVHHFIEEQVKRTPDRIAVQCGTDSLTYNDLDQRAEAIAAHLVRHGVRPETLVAVALPRTPDLVAALLAIWKAGGAYVPIDLAYPTQRIALLLRAARPHLTLTTRAESMPPGVLDGGTLFLEDLTGDATSDRSSAAHASPQSLAYVIFTSGSTGTPKGVAIQHDNAVAFLNWAVNHFSLDRLAAVLASTSVCFDLSVFELFSPLMCGGRVVMVDNALKLIDTPLEGVLLLNTVPSVMRELLNAGAIPKSVRTVNLAGEALPPQLANEVLGLDHVHDVFNLYGPSEDTTYSTWYRIAGMQASAPSIGRSIAGTQLFLLDPRGEPVLRGSIGEIYLGGAGIARGYLQQAGLTASRFVPDPFAKSPGARLYRAGDLARYDDEGQLEFLGRKDDQIKVRGFRVEPAEIEAHLCTHSAVAEAAVVLQESSRGKQLVAFYCSPQKSVDSADLRRYLAKQVPDYMIPAEFQLAEHLPRTSNGKVDRKQLQSTPIHHQGTQRAGVAPSGASEILLAGIWSEVLGIANPGADDDFFESGGDSLLSVRFCAKAQAAGVSIVPGDVRACCTIRALALKTGSIASTPRQKTGGPRSVPLMPSQSFFLNGAGGDPNHFNLSSLLRVDARISPRAWGDVIGALLTTQEALRLRFASGGVAWRAHIADPETEPPFEYVDLRDRSAEADAIIANEAARRQTSLNLTSGPACRFVYFDTGKADSSRLQFVIHHLAADGQSLLALLDDLNTALEQAHSGESIHLLPPFTAWSEWADWWNSCADLPEVLSELDQWLPHCKACTPIPVDFDHKHDLLGEAQELAWTLSSPETAQLRAAASSQSVDVSHLLIRALYRTLADWMGSDAVRLDVIGHGRTFPGAPDVSRTAGYFAARYPLRFDSDRIGAVIQSARDGIGWGVLRHLSRSPRVRCALAGYTNPEVSFNYSSRQQVQPASTRLAVPTDEPVGVTQDPASRRACRLRLFASLLVDRVHIRWQFNPHIHRPSTIERLIAEFGVHTGSLMSGDQLVQTSSR